MPLYEYRCESCDHQFEVIQKFSDPHVSVCPKCGGGPVVKLISSPAFTFKGTGFYITDYARKDQAKKDQANKDQANKDQGNSGGSSSSEKTSEKSDTTDKAAKSTESKPAAAADTSTAKATPKAEG